MILPHAPTSRQDDIAGCLHRCCQPRGLDVNEMSEQFEGDPPLLAVAVEGGGVLVDAHDQADAVLEVLVDDGDAVADAEVGTTGDFRWRTWFVEFDACGCRTTFRCCRYRIGEDGRIVHLKDLVECRIEDSNVVATYPDDSCRSQLPVRPVEVLNLLAGMQLRAHLDDASWVGQELFDVPAELVQLGAGGHRQIFD